MDRMHLNLFTMNAVTHVSPGAWRYPGDRAADYTDRDYWTDIARTAERGGFDAVFFADVRGIYDVYDDDRDIAIERAVQTPSNDPRFLVPAMAEVTDDLGFAITRSTTYNHPYELAREFSTLDHLTDGRIAFNIVTSYLESAAANLGVGQRLDHDDRYDRADEFMDVCYALWEESWDESAVVRDREAGVFTDSDGVHTIDHDGEWFSVRGPHGCEPSPQRTPFIYQAGSSDRGREFAARNAEAVFVSQPTAEKVTEYVADLRERAAGYGRDPDDLLFFPGIVPVVGATVPISTESAVPPVSPLPSSSPSGPYSVIGAEAVPITLESLIAWPASASNANQSSSDAFTAPSTNIDSSMGVAFSRVLFGSLSAW